MPILGIMASQISGHLWAPAGAYDALATVTVPSGGLASVTFAGIPTGYKHLQIRSIARTSSGGYETVLLYRMNGDSTYTNYFGRHLLYGDGSSAAAAANNSSAFTGAAIGTTAGGLTASNVFATTIVDILDYQNAYKNKTLRGLGGIDTNTGGTVSFASSLWLNTAAVSSISIVPYDGSSFAQYTQFALYGVK
jgi:hypothetical protein